MEVEARVLQMMYDRGMAKSARFWPIPAQLLHTVQTIKAPSPNRFLATTTKGNDLFLFLLIA